MARLPVDDCDKVLRLVSFGFDYEGETVMLAPASGFYTDPALGRNEVRIAYILCKEDLKRALVVLAKAIEAYNNRGNVEAGWKEIAGSVNKKAERSDDSDLSAFFQ